MSIAAPATAGHAAASDSRTATSVARRSPAKAGHLELEVRPPSPFRLPRDGGQDGTMRIRGASLRRYFEIEGTPIIVRAWQPARDRVHFRAELTTPGESFDRPQVTADDATATDHLTEALDRLRFALGVDEDLTDFYRRFRGDRLLGRLIRLRPDLRPGRLTTPWDALAWAIAGQLIEARRASLIARRIVRRWGRPGPDGLHDTPTPKAIADRAPAELESCDLSARRAVAMRRVAHDVAAGRIDPASAATDSRLIAIPQIGPWTVQCLGLHGRGEPDTLPAGDLDYLKIVGHFAGLGRRAEIEEVERFFEPYRPYRGLAGEWFRQTARAVRI